MSSLRIQICLITCVLYFGALILPSFLACPCRAKAPVNAADIYIEDVTGCCQAPTAQTCCQANTSAPDEKAVFEGDIPECCIFGMQCLSCTQCSTAKPYLPVHERVTVNPEFTPGFIDFNSETIQSYPFVPVVLDRPPDRVHLAPHISTTVLLC